MKRILLSALLITAASFLHASDNVQKARLYDEKAGTRTNPQPVKSSQPSFISADVNKSDISKRSRLVDPTILSNTPNAGIPSSALNY